jgi:hypothetical protein
MLTACRTTSAAAAPPNTAMLRGLNRRPSRAVVMNRGPKAGEGKRFFFEKKNQKTFANLG